MTAATLGASAALPASACTSDATTTVCCGVSPVAAGLPSPTASPCWSNSVTIVCRICWSSHALDEVGVGPGEALDRRLVALVLRADLHPTARAARNAARSCPGSAPTRSAICSSRETGRQREHGVPAFAAACAGGSLERVDRGLHAHVLVQRVRAGLRRAARDAVPDLERERRADDVLARELVADLLRAPPLLHGHAHRRAVAARFVELPDEPPADDHERQDEQREHAERPATVDGGAALLVAPGLVAATGDRARASTGARRPTTTRPRSPPGTTRRSPSADRFVSRSVRRRDRGADGRRRRRERGADVGLVERTGRRRPLIVGPPPSPASPPSPSSRRWTSPDVRRRGASSHDCRITAAADGVDALALCPLPLVASRRGISEVALGDHRGEPLIVGVDLDPDARRDLGDRRHLVEHRAGGGPQLARQRPGQADHDAASRRPRWRRRRWPGGRRPRRGRVERGVAGWPAHPTGR